jgi:hypothetical protein
MVLIKAEQFPDIVTYIEQTNAKQILAYTDNMLVLRMHRSSEHSYATKLLVLFISLFIYLFIYFLRLFMNAWTVYFLHNSLDLIPLNLKADQKSVSECILELLRIYFFLK